MPSRYEIRSNVSFGSSTFVSFLHFKKVGRAVLPSSVICSVTLSCHSSAIRKNARSAGGDSSFLSMFGCGGTAGRIIFPYMDLSSLLSRPGFAVERLNDQVDPLGVPTLDRLVIGTQHGPKPAPRIQVPLADRMHQAARPDDTPQHVAIDRDQREPRHRLVHARDPLGRGYRGANVVRRPAVVLDGRSYDIQRRTAQPGRPARPG